MNKVLWIVTDGRNESASYSKYDDAKRWYDTLVFVFEDYDAQIERIVS